MDSTVETAARGVFGFLALTLSMFLYLVSLNTRDSRHHLDWLAVMVLAAITATLATLSLFAAMRLWGVA